MFTIRSAVKWVGITCLGIALNAGVHANAQTLNATLVETSKVTDFGLEFDPFQFGSSITPHGDCIDVIDGYLFVAWYRGGMDDRHVMLSRKKIGSGTWKTIEFPHQHVGYRGNPTIGDAHNTIAVTVCPIDNTVHMLYDMHAYNPSELPNDYFNYSVSVPNAAFVPDDQWKLDLFLPKKNELEPNGDYVDVTYPKFVRADDGSIMANWRNGGAGSGNSFYARYDGSSWSQPVMFAKGISNTPSDRWSIYGKLKYEGGNLGYGFSIRWGNARNDDIPYNSGFYYAEAKPPYGANDWYDIDGNSITLPISNPDVVKVGEPTDLGLGNQITGGADWTRTKNGAVHFMTVVSGNFVHYYRPVGSNTFITDLNSPLSDMIPAGEYVLMADTVAGRPYIRVAPEGTKNWQVIHDENSGPSMDYYVVDLEGDTLVYYSRQPGNTTSEPLHVTVYQLDIPGIENPNYHPEPTIGPVAHWPLDDGSETVTANTAGTHYTATLENGPGWGGDAERASYVTFNGTNQRISTTFTYALSATDDFTWAWWAKKDPTAGAGSIMVGNRHGGTGPETYEFIKFTPSEAQFANTSNTPTNITIERYNYDAITDTGWNHYAMVKSGVTCQWYVNGTPKGAPVTPINYNETTPLPFFMGGDSAGYGNEHFKGGIDDVVLYRRALTPQDVVSVKNGVYLPHTPPTISAIRDQTVLANVATAPLAFMIGDDMTSPGSITLTASSSNTALVPEENIIFGGSEANRTVTVTPLPDQSGSAVISVTANDGSLTATSTFTLTVMPPGTISTTMTYHSAGPDSWVCPPGVSMVQVECWGGGGAGGAADAVGTANVGGGGGAGGSYARMANVPVTADASYSIMIPAAASALADAANGARFNGGSVSFSGDDGMTVTAAGGQGGESRVGGGNISGTGGTGSTTGSDGEAGAVFAGGNGAQGGDRDGGGGGGSAGDKGSGGTATGTTAGSAGTVGGAAGGNGRGGHNNGQPGQNPGGGGGGAKSQSSQGGEAKSGGMGGLGQIVLTYFQVPVDPPNTAQEDWRELHFGTTENLIPAADPYDANADGESNLLEFATGQNPHAGTRARTEVAMNGGDLEFRYSCSKAALADGMTFQVEWCDSLLVGSWSGAGVTYEPDSSLPVDSELEHWIASAPVSTEGRRFVRLKVSKPRLHVLSITLQNPNSAPRVRYPIKKTR